MDGEAQQQQHHRLRRNVATQQHQQQQQHQRAPSDAAAADRDQLSKHSSATAPPSSSSLTWGHKGIQVPLMQGAMMSGVTTTASAAATASMRNLGGSNSFSSPSGGSYAAGATFAGVGGGGTASVLSGSLLAQLQRDPSAGGHFNVEGEQQQQQQPTCAFGELRPRPSNAENGRLGSLTLDALPTRCVMRGSTTGENSSTIGKQPSSHFAGLLSSQSEYTEPPPQHPGDGRLIVPFSRPPEKSLEDMSRPICIVDGQPKMPAQITDVWAFNVRQEMDVIRSLVNEYPYITLDTEFPGVVAKPVGGVLDSVEDYYYKTVKINVDLMKVIQVGFTLTNGRGTSPPGTSTWQFNFRFVKDEEIYAAESIAFLQASGIDFNVLAGHGVDPEDFGELLFNTGLVLNPDISWVTYHGTYDFAYMLQLVRGGLLPETQAEFFATLHRYFPVHYDLKFIAQSPRCQELAEHSSLQRLAAALGVVRKGKQHQAGSDSLVTSLSFFRVMERWFNYEMDDEQYMSILYGLGGWKGMRYTAQGQLQAIAASVLIGDDEEDSLEDSDQTEQRRNTGTERLQKAWESTASRDAATGARFMFGFEPPPAKS